MAKKRATEPDTPADDMVTIEAVWSKLNGTPGRGAVDIEDAIAELKADGGHRAAVLNEYAKAVRDMKPGDTLADIHVRMRNRAQGIPDVESTPTE